MCSGIYIITCLPNGKRYVGSSVQIPVRWSQHKTDLRGGYHGNAHFQRCWDKYGPEAFTWEVLERSSPEELVEREQHYLDTLRPELNGSPNATAPMRGQTMSEEQKAKISVTLRARYSGKPGNRLGTKHSAESRAKISAGLKGNTYRRGKTMSEATKVKMRESQRLRRARERQENV